MEGYWFTTAAAACWVFYLVAILDWWRTDPVDVRTMAKPAWVLSFLFFWILGAAAWFVWGHPWRGAHDT